MWGRHWSIIAGHSRLEALYYLQYAMIACLYRMTQSA